MRHSSLQSARPTLLFLHGLGDSSLSYLPYLQAPALFNFNVLIPDLLGYGENIDSRNDNYNFLNQVEDIVGQIHKLEREEKLSFNEIILIPHSMASIHAMLLYRSQLNKNIKGCINVEGSVTQYGSFISEKLVAENIAGNFENGFNEFIKSCQRTNPLYYDSLIICDKNAFLQNAIEMQKFCHIGTGKYSNIAGRMFADLESPKVYCHGDNLCQETVDFLHVNSIHTKLFHTSSHFVMQKCFIEFSDYIARWLNWPCN